jgi:hypothetical protein
MLLAGEQPFLVGRPVASFQLHCGSKSFGNRRLFTQEDREVFVRHAAALSPEERALAHCWLRENEAGVLLDTIYAQLALQKRWAAAVTFLENLFLLPLVAPRKAVLGLAWRTFVTGRPPGWFRSPEK